MGAGAAAQARLVDNDDIECFPESEHAAPAGKARNDGQGRLTSASEWGRESAGGEELSYRFGGASISAVNATRRTGLREEGEGEGRNSRPNEIELVGLRELQTSGYTHRLGSTLRRKNSLPAVALRMVAKFVAAVKSKDPQNYKDIDTLLKIE